MPADAEEARQLMSGGGLDADATIGGGRGPRSFDHDLRSGAMSCGGEGNGKLCAAAPKRERPILSSSTTPVILIVCVCPI